MSFIHSKLYGTNIVRTETVVSSDETGNPKSERRIGVFHVRYNSAIPRYHNLIACEETRVERYYEKLQRDAEKAAAEKKKHTAQVSKDFKEADRKASINKSKKKKRK